MSPHPPRRTGPALLWGRSVTLCLVLLVSPTQGQAPLHAQVLGSSSSLRGQVLEHETGMPLAGAAVSLASGPGGTEGIGTRVTNSEGRFLFRQVPPGTYRVIVTVIGYRDLQETLQVDPESELELTLPMSISPIEMEPLLVVTERGYRGVMGDFEGRRRSRPGTFFNREEIEARQPRYLTDLLRMVPGARVVPTGSHDYTVLLRGGCRPSLVVDGIRLMTELGMNDILPTMDLEAVEVYHSASVPVEFGSNPCGAIVVWTRRGEPTNGEGNFWRRFAFAAGFSLLALLLAG